MTATASTTKLPTGTWNVDPVHSSVGFEVPYVVGTFKGQFAEVAAQLRVAEDGTAELQGSSPVASIRVQDENLNGHLLSPEFFDAERHPELRFAARDLVVEDGAFAARGELEIKGIAHEVEARGTLTGPVTDGWGTEKLGLKLSAQVDRTAFGIEWNTPLPTGEPALGNEVTIVTELVFAKEA